MRVQNENAEEGGGAVEVNKITNEHVQTPVTKDDPRMIAWNEYKSTDAYANSLKWALARKYDDGRPIAAEQCVLNAEGSLWAAFIAGFESGGLEHRQGALGVGAKLQGTITHWQPAPPEQPQGQPEKCKSPLCGEPLCPHGKCRGSYLGCEECDGPMVTEAAQPQMSAREFCERKGWNATQIIHSLNHPDQRLYLFELLEAFARSRVKVKGETMKYEAVKDSMNINDWRVEAFGNEGECFVTIFSGPDAEPRAKEYANWKNL